MSEPFFSILVPAYNNAKTLPTTLDSIIKQTNPDFEIIVCDDGSNDGTLEILKDYSSKDNRLKYFKHEQNLKTLNTRRDLIQEAHGQYITFVDADDEILPNFLEVGREALINSSLDILTFPIKGIDKKGDSNIKLTGKDVFEFHFLKSVATWNIYARFYKSSLLKGLAIPDLPLCTEDDLIIVFLAFYFAKEVQYKSTPALYKYNLGAGGWGHKLYSKEKFTSLCYEHHVAYKFLYNFLLQNCAEKEYFARLPHFVSSASIIELNKKESLEIFISDCSKEELATSLSEYKFLSANSKTVEGIKISFWFLINLIKRWGKRMF